MNKRPFTGIIKFSAVWKPVTFAPYISQPNRLRSIIRSLYISDFDETLFLTVIEYYNQTHDECKENHFDK